MRYKVFGIIHIRWGKLLHFSSFFKCISGEEFFSSPSVIVLSLFLGNRANGPFRYLKLMDAVTERLNYHLKTSITILTTVVQNVIDCLVKSPIILSCYISTFFFPSFTEISLINTNFIYVKCITWCFDIHVCYDIISAIKLLKIYS